MTNLNTNIFLSSNVILDQNLSDYAVAAYVGIRILNIIPAQHHIITSRLIGFYLGKGDIQSRSFTAHIEEGVEELKTAAVIDVVRETPSYYVINSLNVDSRFCIAKYSDILNIIESNRVSLLRFYLLVLISRDHHLSARFGDESKSNIIGYMGSSYFAKIMQCQEKTISNYFHVLENMRIIYTRRISTERFSGDIMTKIYYGLYEDRKFIDAYVNDLRLSSPETLYDYTPTVNTHRALAQMFNKLRKCVGSGEDIPYSAEEIQQIYDYVSAQNSYWEEEYNKTGSEFAKLKIRDLSVFDTLKGELLL